MGADACSVPDCGASAAKRGYCQRHYKRVWRHGDPDTLLRAVSTPGVTQESKKQYVMEYKLQQGCADCGYAGHHAALDFDHVRGETKVRDIKHGNTLGWQALLDEIDKCDVVCANCHRIRTFERGRL